MKKTLEEHQAEFEESFRKDSKEELTEHFNSNVRNKGWVSIRGAFSKALMNVFNDKGVDTSVVYDGTTIDCSRKVKLVNDKLVIDE